MDDYKKSPLGDLGALVAPSVLGSANPSLYEGLLIRAREMSSDPTNAEKLLWEKLRNKRLGVKFRQQHIVDRFIVDFCSIKSALVIEIDGKIHEMQIEEDEERTRVLESRGYRVIRFKNEEIYFAMESVLTKIKAFIEEKSPRPPKGGV